MPKQQKETQMERSTLDSLRANLEKAIDDLRQAGDDASGDVRTRIDAAVERIREASTSASGRAQEGAGQLRDTVDELRETIRRSTAEVLDDLQKEIDKRRQQLGI